MAKLAEDFPGRTELEAAGITTEAQLRKAMEAGDNWYEEIAGIGPATAEKIAAGAQKTGTDDDKLTDLDTTAVSPGEMAALKGGKPSPLAAQDASTLDRLNAEDVMRKAEEDNSVHARLSRSGYFLNENQITGERWIGETIQNDPNADAASKSKTRVTNIAEVRPFRGLQVRPKNGEPFVVSEEFDRDATPKDWFAVLDPSTNKSFLDVA